jgi:hypothetical protein
MSIIHENAETSTGCVWALAGGDTWLLCRGKARKKRLPFGKALEPNSRVCLSRDKYRLRYVLADLGGRMVIVPGGQHDGGKARLRGKIPLNFQFLFCSLFFSFLAEACLKCPGGTMGS